MMMMMMMMNNKLYKKRHQLTCESSFQRRNLRLVFLDFGRRFVQTLFQLADCQRKLSIFVSEPLYFIGMSLRQAGHLGMCFGLSSQLFCLHFTYLCLQFSLNTQTNDGTAITSLWLFKYLEIRNSNDSVVKLGSKRTEEERIG